MALRGFFNQTPAIQEKRVTPYSFISVGGDLFQAVAVALIDALKHSPRMNEASLKKILARFFYHYPKFASSQACLTPAERMGMLLNSSRKSEIVKCMAFVLRQIAVDEIYAHPLNCREAFAGLCAEDSQELLRQASTVLPVASLRPLCDILALTVNLSIVEQGKELRKRHSYTNPASGFPKLSIEVQVQGDAYFPGVKNKADFAYVGQVAIASPQPVMPNEQPEKNLAEYIHLINEDNKDLAQEFKRLTVIISKNVVECLSKPELKPELIALFVTFYPEKESLFGNTNEFFNGLMHSDKNPITAATCTSTPDLIARTIAGWICANQINADEFFEAAELKIAKSAGEAGMDSLPKKRRLSY